MTGFSREFKKFINRGNVFDMAVGVIVGSAFTAIVTALTNNILKPITNWIIMLLFGADSLAESYTFLHKVLAEDGNIDLEQSIYIDWGAFVNAIFQFVIVAFVLFCILKAVNNLREEIEEARKKRFTREQRKELRANGIKPKDKEAARAYFEEKKAKEKAEEEERIARERAENPTTEDLLKLILAEMRGEKVEAEMLSE